MHIKNKVLMGSVFCIASACLWGVSGAAGQYMFHNANITPEWLVSIRMLLTGIFMLTFAQIKKGGILQIWLEKQDRKEVILFALIGMLFMQYAYFAAINDSNAATATVLQYLAPIMIVVYLAFRQKKLPNTIECLSVLGALIGTILLATHGNLKSLSLSPNALFWGLLSAVALAFYTVYPVRLLSRFDTMLLIGWAMLIGGIAMNIIHPFWQWQGDWNATSVFCLIFIIVFGTMVPYMMFLNGVKYIGPTKSSLYASVEPLSSTIVSVLWLKVHLEFIDYIGFLFIVITVLMLSFAKPKPKKA
ncbi:EamA family transporter [Anaerotignum sp.]